MHIGVPKEIMVLEGRVALVPEACHALVEAGHQVLVEQGAGEASGYPDNAYRQAGAVILDDAAAVYGQAQLIVKVKQPLAEDLALLTADHIVFSFLHLAPDPELARELQDIGCLALAFETLESRGQLPLLAPMSDIAGRIAVQTGASLLHRPQGGKGILLGGVAGTERGNVVIIGAGHAGSNAVKMAAGMGANVTVFDHNREQLEAMRLLGPNITSLYPYPQAVANAVAGADLLIGAVLVTGARAPHVVSRAMVETMQDDGVIIDISVDQGGCIETTEPTQWSEPTYKRCGVTHFGVVNMPGAVPRTSSQALSAALIPYLLRLAEQGVDMDNQLQTAVNIRAGEIVHPAVQRALAGA